MLKTMTLPERPEGFTTPEGRGLHTEKPAVNKDDKWGDEVTTG